MNVKVDWSKENQHGVQQYKLTLTFKNGQKITNNFYIVDSVIKDNYVELYNGYENDFFELYEKRFELDETRFELDETPFERIAICKSKQEAQKELKKYIEKFFKSVIYILNINFI